MSKSQITIKANAIFLATVLVAGIIALSYPSFMVGVNAQEYVMDERYDSYKPDSGSDYGRDSYDETKSYGKDASYDKSKDSVLVKKIKCNNINVNLNGFNGLELNALPTTLNGLATEAQAADEGEVGASSFGSGGGGSDGRPSSGQGSDNWCINNNEFVVIDGRGGTTPDPTPDPTCEECFADISVALRTAIENVLGGTGPVTIPGTDIEIDAQTILALCEELGLDPLELTRAQIELAITAFIGTNTSLEAEVRELIRCLIDARVIIVIPDDDDPTCLECFQRLSLEIQAFINVILEGSGSFPIPGSTPEVEIPADVDTFAELCEFLDIDANVINVTEAELTALNNLFIALGGSTEIGTALVTCLIQADIIIVTQ